MKISLHIDQIVIEGASLTRREREHLAATLERELVRQLGQRAAGGPGGPARAGRDRDAAGGSRLAGPIAAQVLAALPADTAGALGGGTAGALAAGRRPGTGLAGRRLARAAVRRAGQ
jgi:hypothetical protein